MSEQKIPDACARFLSAVGDLVAGDAPASLTAECDAHGRECHTCAEELALARRIESQLSTLPDLEPPEHMWTSLQPRLDEVDREPAESRQRAPRLVPKLVRSPARG